MNDKTEKSSSENSQESGKFQWLSLIGPGLVAACVVIGPGSILTSSKVGASQGYSQAWVVLVAVFFMFTYIAMAAKLGAVSQQSTCDLICQHAGRWLALLVGGSVFFISAAFQFGNNLGVHSAISTYWDFKYSIVFFNGLALLFLFSFRNLYRLIERLMSFFVALMLIAFATNLSFAKPDLGELFSGFVPSFDKSQIGMPLLGLVGTTFVITIAFYQSYLVRFKGWKEEDLKAGLMDARVSAAIMALITLMIMSTSAAVFRGEELHSVAQVANQLEPLFGEKGRVLFCIGLFSAAFSSFIINSMVGGFILSDSFGIGNKPEDRWPRILTAVVLLVGMAVALYVIERNVKPVVAIVAAQAVTVVAAPLLAATLLWLCNSKAIMGEHRNHLRTNVVAGLGLLLLVLTSWYIATTKVWPALQDTFTT